MNKKGLGIIAIVIVVVFIAAAAFYFLYKPATTSSTESAASANILAREGTIQASIENFAFKPSEIKIKVGSNITWTNYDNVPHTITSDSGDELNSQLLSTNQVYSHTFNQKGIFTYHCTPHPYMKGTVVVE